MAFNKVIIFSTIQSYLPGSSMDRFFNSHCTISAPESGQTKKDKGLLHKLCVIKDNFYGGKLIYLADIMYMRRSNEEITFMT